MNKNISVWRGSKTPPTNYHVWINEKNEILLHNGSEWKDIHDDDLKSLEKELLSRIQGTSENSDAVKDPFKLITLPNGYNFSNLDDLIAILDSMHANTAAEGKKYMGAFRAILSSGVVTIYNTPLSVGDDVWMQTIIGCFRFDDDGKLTIGYNNYGMFYRKLENSEWSSWKIANENIIKEWISNISNEVVDEEVSQVRIELEKRIQGKSENSDAVKDPFKFIGNFDGFESLIEKLDTMHNVEGVTGSSVHNGHFRALVGSKLVDIVNEAQGYAYDVWSQRITCAGIVLRNDVVKTETSYSEYSDDAGHKYRQHRYVQKFVDAVSSSTNFDIKGGVKTFCRRHHLTGNNVSTWTPWYDVENPYVQTQNYGKKIALFGASFAQNFAVSGYEFTHEGTSYKLADYIAEKLGAVAFDDYAVGSQGMRCDDNSPFPVHLMNQLKTAQSNDIYDIYIIMGGVNDYWCDKVPLGESTGYASGSSDDEEQNISYCGGLLKAIDYIRLNAPNAKIYTITPFKGYNAEWGWNPRTKIRNAYGNTFYEFVQAQKEVSQVKGVPCLDLWAMQGFSGANASKHYISDLLHPNGNGYYKASEKIVEFVAHGVGSEVVDVQALSKPLDVKITEEIQRAKDAEKANRQFISDLVGESPETLDTIYEISSWILNDETGAAAMAKKINENENAIVEEVQRATKKEAELQKQIDNIPSLNIPLATPENNGLMSAEDKVKLYKADNNSKAESFRTTAIVGNTGSFCKSINDIFFPIGSSGAAEHLIAIGDIPAGNYEVLIQFADAISKNMYARFTDSEGNTEGLAYIGGITQSNTQQDKDRIVKSFSTQKGYTDVYIMLNTSYASQVAGKPIGVTIIQRESIKEHITKVEQSITEERQRAQAAEEILAEDIHQLFVSNGVASAIAKSTLNELGGEADIIETIYIPLDATGSMIRRLPLKVVAGKKYKVNITLSRAIKEGSELSLRFVNNEQDEKSVWLPTLQKGIETFTSNAKSLDSLDTDTAYLRISTGASSKFAGYTITVIVTDYDGMFANGRLGKLEKTIKELPTTTSVKKLKVLCIGNSFTQDAMGYVPYIMKNVAPDVDLTLGIAYIGGSPLAWHLANLIGESVTVADKTYSPQEYEIYSKSVNGDKWAATFNKDIDSILNDDDWDIITFQQSGGTSGQDYDIHYAPFLHHILKEVSSRVVKPVKFGWLSVHGTYNTTAELNLRHYERTVANTQKVVDDTSIDVVFPYGTAVQNLRTIADLNTIGNYEYGFMQADSGHLQNGIGCLCASYSCALKLLEIIGEARGVMGDTLVVDDTFMKDNNIPGPNPQPIEGDYAVLGITDRNRYLAQVAAVQAIKKPYEVTDINKCNV